MALRHLQQRIIVEQNHFGNAVAWIQLRNWLMNLKKEKYCFSINLLGWTSFKVVGHARYHICRRIGVKKLKVGHAGTLDPLATGGDGLYAQARQPNE